MGLCSGQAHTIAGAPKPLPRPSPARVGWRKTLQLWPRWRSLHVRREVWHPARSMRPKHAPEACTHDNPMPTRIQESRLGVALCGPALTLVLAAALDDFRRCHPVRLSVAPSWHAQRRWRASSGTRGAIHRPCQGPSRVSERQRSGARRCPP